MARFQVALVGYDADGVPDWVVQDITGAGIELDVRQCADDEEVSRFAKGADLVWVFGGPTVVTSRVLPSLGRCRVILRSGSGTDNVPVNDATALGIIVANTPEAVAATVAEHTIGLLLAVVRQIAVQDRAVHQGTWDRDLARPRWRLTGRTFGLIGFGHIAREVARKAAGFDLRIIAHDPAVDAQVMADHDVEAVDFHDLLEQSDCLSIHCPLIDQTRHLIGERELKMMKPESILINTSRGPVIDEPALTRALFGRQIAGAGLDVLDSEPPGADNPLLGLANVVITPHIAGVSDTFLTDFWRDSVRTVIETARTGRPVWIVNPDVRPRLGVKPQGCSA